MWKVKFRHILMVYWQLEVWPADPMATLEPKLCTVPPPLRTGIQFQSSSLSEHSLNYTLEIFNKAAANEVEGN